MRTEGSAKPPAPMWLAVLDAVGGLGGFVSIGIYASGRIWPTSAAQLASAQTSAVKVTSYEAICDKRIAYKRIENDTAGERRLARKMRPRARRGAVSRRRGDTGSDSPYLSRGTSGRPARRDASTRTSQDCGDRSSRGRHADWARCTGSFGPRARRKQIRRWATRTSSRLGPR